MIFRRFEEMKGNFTKSEARLRDYITGNLDFVQKYNASELADKTGVSQATIVRFSKKLGYKGFPEMRIALNKEEEKTGKILNNRIELEDDIYSVNKKISGLNTQAINGTLELLEEDVFKEAISLLERADKVMVLGAGSSSLVAKDFAYKLLKLGKNVYSESDTQIQAGNLNNFSEEDVIVAICHLGNSKEILKMVELARKKGIKVISISKFVNNPLSKKSDVRLKTSASEEVFNISSITTRIAQLALIDMLYVNMVKDNFNKYNTAIKQNKEMMRKYKSK